MIAVAPGKVMLAGEYAVLRGRPALVMAVNRYAAARVSPGCVQPPEVVATLALARREGFLADEHPDIGVDCSQLARDDGTKLGLGGSAAGCVAALALARRIEGYDAGDRLAVGRIARRGHQEAQGGGSGVDVLASALGGVLRVLVAENAEPVVTTRTWPVHWPWAVLWTGVSVRTSDMLTRVAALEARDKRSAESCWTGMARAAGNMDAAIARGSVDAAVHAVREAGWWLSELGRRSGVSIVTEALAQFILNVAPMGVGVKPSGAGGGDVALMIGQDETVLAKAMARAAQSGFVAVELAPDTLGVRVIEGGQEQQ